MPCEQNITHLIGIDGQGNGYVRSDYRWFSRITNNSTTWKGQLTRLKFSEEENLVYTSAFLDSQLYIQGLDQNGQLKKEVRLDIPANLIDEEDKVLSFAYFDEQGKYYIYAGETRTEDGTLLTYSPDGILEEEKYPAPEMHLQENRMQWRYWNVDAAGKLYISFLGSNNFHLLRITLPAPEEP